MSVDEKEASANNTRMPLTTRVFMLEGDVRNHSRIITALVQDGQSRAVESARREEQDKIRDRDLKAIKDLVRWVAGGIGIVILAQIGNFIISGALSAVH